MLIFKVKVTVALRFKGVKNVSNFHTLLQLKNYQHFLNRCQQQTCWQGFHKFNKTNLSFLAALDLEKIPKIAKTVLELSAPKHKQYALDLYTRCQVGQRQCH